ncbi:MAG TPA: RsmD family RNA methyltransferase [Candidatus Limnocylindrales bacterium]|nr:RsmD family RNA methyltransferase [Candidatus Limnocylindrales bacterium]
MAEAGRVISGLARGIRLQAPPAVTRPLTDRVKQSLFGAMLADGAVGEGTAFLDLFAGSGAAGIEALSLGAGEAVFVERDGGAARVIGANLERTGLTGGRVVRLDAVRWLDRPAEPPAPFNGAVVDPPYGDEELLAATLERLGRSGAGWLADGALVVAKHFWRDELPDRVGQLTRERDKRFGETMLTFYRYQP